MVNVNNSYVATPPIDGGVLHSGSLGTPLPNDALEVLHETFLANDHGAVGENGIAINRSKTTQKIRMFGGGNFRTVITETDHSVKVTLLEDDNTVVLETINGADNVIVHDADEDGLKKTIYHGRGFADSVVGHRHDRRREVQALRHREGSGHRTGRGH
ncbi:hypothetical protein GCM10020255_066810 [Rhodococcus baikonurensis]